MKLGSLFDGSGGFPLAGAMCGVNPIWASEVEPYPIAVTKTRFPNMKHYGNVCALNGAKVEPVDIITFGSPCQDLSVAGKRAGLRHEENGDEETTRSGLFMEAVRIIKEMREATNGEYPTFALWENVPGAFSSNKGEDFRTVLKELIKIVEPEAIMPAVPKNGWPYADSYCGDGWSLAYRVFDAQYWGVPQRRRRIHLILDLRGERARKVLFEREGVCGYFAEGRTPWQSLTTDTQDCTGADDRKGAVAYSFDSLASNSMKSKNPHSGCRQVEVAKTLDTTDPNPSKNQGGIAIVEPVAYTLKIRSGCEGGGKGALVQENKSATLATNNDQYLFQPVSNILLDDEAPTLRAEAHVNVSAVVCYDARGNGDGETVNTITGDHENRITDYTSVIVEKKPVYCLQGNGIDRADTAGCNGKGWKEDTSYTLNTIDRPAVAYCASGKETYQKVTGPLMANSHPGSYTGQDAFNDMLVAYPEPVAYSMKSISRSGKPLTEQANPICASDYKDPDIVAYPEHGTQYIVRRLTPTECARLQGFPDTWGHIDHKDDFTDEEYTFWTEVRCTHAAINGKEPKTYSKEQMLKWYNGLHTDSAEYKMWGNGIALPPALYCMQGMAEAKTIGGPQ